MTPVRHVIYLHGFASSPSSSKATWYRRELAALGIDFRCPDFNQPSFETLTITRMLEQTRAAIETAADGPIALVGASLGAFVALHAAAADRTGRVDRLILLAPAIDFGGNRLRQFGEHGIDEWRRTGKLTVYHFSDGTLRDVGFGLYEDAARYDALTLDVSLPALAVQGRRDDIVDPRAVEQWASTRPYVDLRLVDDDHQLKAVMPYIWDESVKFFGLQAQ